MSRPDGSLIGVEAVIDKDWGGYSKVGEIPFDFERRRLSVIVQHGDELLLITKGAPESVLPFCSTYEINNASKPLDDAARANFVKMYQDLNTQGYRALAVAYRSVPQEAHYSVTDERNMVLLGFLTFFIMLNIFHTGPVLFHTGWFVESLATQTLVLFVIRTAGNPLRSRPSLPLTISVLLVVAIGILLPYTPLAGPLGFTPLPGLYFLFLIAMTVTYLLLVELVKRPLMRQYTQ